MRWQLAVLMCLPAMAAITAARADCDCAVVFCTDQEQTSWIFRPSYFSHDPDTGKRVDQYEPEQVTYYRDDPTYLESGFRHYQYEIEGPGGTADRLHVVQTWGLGDLIRPYGEWEFPYRAGRRPMGLGAIRRDRGPCLSIHGRIHTACCNRCKVRAGGLIGTERGGKACLTAGMPGIRSRQWSRDMDRHLDTAAAWDMDRDTGMAA